MELLTNALPVCFILTSDMARAKRFYGDILGLRQTGEDGFATSYDLAGTLLRLTLVPDYVPHAHTVIGWQVADIRARMAELRTKGVTFLVYEGFGQDADGVWTDEARGKQLAWFADPDGNNLCLAQG